MQDNKLLTIGLFTVKEIGNECLGYLPSPETQNWHSCAIIQLYGPGHLCVLHGVHLTTAGEKQQNEKLSMHLLHTLGHYRSFPLPLFSPQTATAESMSFLYLCWFYFSIWRVSFLRSLFVLPQFLSLSYFCFISPVVNHWTTHNCTTMKYYCVYSDCKLGGACCKGHYSHTGSSGHTHIVRRNLL